jgi:Xaa-Pro aminopeptidase
MSISKDEFLRRYSGIRRGMKDHAIDCLIIAGRNDYFSRGNIRYVTGLAFGGYALFPLEGKPVYFLTRNQIGSPKHRKAGPLQDLIEFIELQEPVADIADQMTRFDGGRNIGIVGMTDVPVPTYLGLKERLGERMVDGGAIFRDMRTIKSGEEIGKMRIAASIADRVCAILRETIRPGLIDYEIYGAVKKAIYEMGCDYSMELIDAAGSTMNMAWSPSGDRLEETGTLFLEITPAFDGYYAQLPVSLPVREYTPLLRRMVDAWSIALERGASYLRPGVPVGEVHRAAVGAVEERGFISPFQAGHAIGLDVIDFWSIGQSNATILQPGMTVAFHPCALSDLGGPGIGMGYTYLITDEGPEKLSSIDLV